MVIRTKHLWAAGAVIALVAMFFVLRADRLAAERKLWSANLVMCEQESARTAVMAAWAFDAARTRAAQGDAKTAKRYNGYATSIIGQIPVPPKEKGNPAVADVEEINVPRTNNLTFRLTDAAKDIQEQGCRLVHKRP